MEQNKFCKCGMLLVKLCKNCGNPQPSPYHDEAYKDRGSVSFFESSGKIICMRCDWPLLEPQYDKFHG